MATYDLGSIGYTLENTGGPKTIAELKQLAQAGIEAHRSVAQISQGNRLAQYFSSVEKQITTVNRSMQNHSRFLAQAAQGSNRFGVVTQQAGYQIGDFLVQVQSGTNWMVAFGQQATQLVGVLPLMGAGFLGLSSGALVALSAGLGIAIPLITAIGAYFMRAGDSAEKAKDQVNDLDSAIKNIDASLKKWTQTKQAAAEGMTVEQMFGGQSLAQAKTDLGVALRIAQAIQKEIEDGNAKNKTGLDTIFMQKLESIWGGDAISRLNAATAAVEVAKQRIADIDAKLAEEQKQNSDDSRVALQNEFDMQLSIAKFGEDSEQTKALANKQALDDYNRQIDAQVRINELTEEQGSKLKATNLLNTYLLDIAQKLAAVAAQELIVTKNQREADDARAQERLANEKAYQAAIDKGLAKNQYWSDQAKAAERQAAAVDYIVKNLNLLGAKKDAEGFNKALQEALDAGVKFSVVDLSSIVSLAAKNGWNLAAALKAAWAAASQSSPAAASVLMGGGRPEVNLDDMKYRGAVIEGRANIAETNRIKDEKKTGGAEKKDPLAELQKQIALQEELNGKTEAEQRVRQALGDDYSKYSSVVIKGLEDQIQKQMDLEDHLKEQQGLYDTIQSSMEDAFMSMVDGTKTAKDAFKSMALAIIKELYNVLVVQRMVGSFDQATGQGSGIMGAIFKGVAGAFGGGSLSSGPNSGYVAGMAGRASGGPISAGTPYMVGERGPEMIIPKSSGMVLTNGQTKAALGGSSNESYVVNNNISVTGSDSVMVRQEIAKMIPQISSATKAAMIDAKRRGGQMGNAFR